MIAAAGRLIREGDIVRIVRQSRLPRATPGCLGIEGTVTWAEYDGEIRIETEGGRSCITTIDCTERLALPSLNESLLLRGGSDGSCN